MTRQYAFCYGTLKQGHGNSRWMEGVEPIGDATIKDVVIVSSGSLPYAIHRDGKVAHGELYETTMEHVERIDHLEGHPTFYTRKLTKVECNGKEYSAWVYYCEKPNTINLPEVEGMWV